MCFFLLYLCWTILCPEPIISKTCKNSSLFDRISKLNECGCLGCKNVIKKTDRTCYMAAIRILSMNEFLKVETQKWNFFFSKLLVAWSKIRQRIQFLEWRFLGVTSSTASVLVSETKNWNWLLKNNLQWNFNWNEIPAEMLS